MAPDPESTVDLDRAKVVALIRAHLTEELELDPSAIQEDTRFREDLDADSLDLYTLVQELEDSYGVKMSDEQAAKILTVGQAVDFVLATVGPGARRRRKLKLERLLDELPEELAGPALTHASWSSHRSDSYDRLAFLGDSVLALAVTTHLYPRLRADQFGAGDLTKVRAQAVSGRSCRSVAERLGIAEQLRTAAPPEAEATVQSLIGTERVLASVLEAVIGACYLAHGYERTAEAVVEAFGPEIDEALERPADYKSTLQERLARRGELVSYEVVDERGPPHDRTFQISAIVAGSELGRGTGRSKKDAEQEAARTALEALA